MRKINGVRYDVAPGEVITVTITRTGTALPPVANLDGAPLAPQQAAGPVTFVFPVTNPAGRLHSLLVSCPFSPGAGSGARFDFTVTSSTGDSSGKLLGITPQSLHKLRHFRFKVT